MARELFWGPGLFFKLHHFYLIWLNGGLSLKVRYLLFHRFKTYTKVKKPLSHIELDTCREVLLVIFIPPNFDTYSFA